MKSTRSGACPAGPQEAGLMGQPNGNVNWYIYFLSLECSYLVILM